MQPLWLGGATGQESSGLSASEARFHSIQRHYNGAPRLEGISYMYSTSFLRPRHSTAHQLPVCTTTLRLAGRHQASYMAAVEQLQRQQQWLQYQI